MQPQWKIFYTDHSVFTSQDGTPFDAPTDGVQIVAQAWPNARGFIIDFKNLYGKDFFVWDEAWGCVDLTGLIQYIRRRQGPKQILLGEMCFQSEQFQQYLDRANREGIE